MESGRYIPRRGGRGDAFELLGETTILAMEKFTSGFYPLFKSVAFLSSPWTLLCTCEMLSGVEKFLQGKRMLITGDGGYFSHKLGNVLKLFC